MVAAGLIVVGVMFTGGNAQAAFAKMKKAITQVTSAHLHIEINAPLTDLADMGSNNPASSMGSKSDDKSDDSSKMLAMGIGAAVGSGNKSIDVWSEGNKWKAQVFGQMNAIYNDGYVTVMFGDQVMAKVKADKNMFPKGVGDPTNVTDFLSQNLKKATDEMNQHCNVQSMGSVVEDGKTLQQLQVTGLDDKGKNWRLMYWVDTDTNLPARFQVFAKTESGQQKLIATITCDYNQQYPDSMFNPAITKP